MLKRIFVVDGAPGCGGADAVDEQLTHGPMVETRNRKPMRPNPLAPWELRIADLRVYYDIEQEPEQVVYVRAVGVKQGNRVRIADEVIDLSGIPSYFMT